MSKRSQTIRLNAATAQTVSVAGSFHDWKAAPMLPGKKGEWSLAVPLPTGRHQFKFVVDARWRCDVENAGGSVLNAFGTTNRVSKVPSELERG